MQGTFLSGGYGDGTGAFPEVLLLQVIRQT